MNITKPIIRKIKDNETALAEFEKDIKSSEVEDTKDITKTVIVSTASPYKFSKDVISSIQSIDCNLDDFEIINKLSDLSKTKIPGPIEKLKELAPAAFVFMSSKDIYLLRDKLEKIL